MKSECFLVKPTAGSVVRIYAKHRRRYFLCGFCRSLLSSGTHVFPVGGFKQGTSADLVKSWAEPHDFGALPLDQLYFEFAAEARWMKRSQPKQP